jgi:cephalosporin-C deacetylase
MKRLIALICIAAIAMQAQNVDMNQFFLKGTTDKNPLHYQVGETITFTLNLETKGQAIPDGYTIKWNRTGDDGVADKGDSPANQQPLVIKTKAEKPGFVRIYAELYDNNGNPARKPKQPGRSSGDWSKVFFEGSAAADPLLMKTTQEPQDFDEFWKRQLARLDATPLQPTLQPVPSKNPKVAIYAVTIPCPGPDNRPATGYITIPANAKDKSIPAELTVHGRGYILQDIPTNGPENKVVFEVNAHGYDLGKDKEYYDEYLKNTSSNGHGYGFDPIQNSNPETAYFNGMALRDLQALRYLKTRIEWNQKDLKINGGSQGGLQAIWLAALDHDVTTIAPSVPWCCDMGGKSLGRIIGSWHIKYVPQLDYYDPIFHAARIPTSCNVNIARAGLGDYVSPPSGVFIFFSKLKCPKSITWIQGGTHGYTPPQPNFSFTIK